METSGRSRCCSFVGGWAQRFGSHAVRWAQERESVQIGLVQISLRGLAEEDHIGFGAGADKEFLSLPNDVEDQAKQVHARDTFQASLSSGETSPLQVSRPCTPMHGAKATPPEDANLSRGETMHVYAWGGSGPTGGWNGPST